MKLYKLKGITPPEQKVINKYADLNTYVGKAYSHLNTLKADIGNYIQENGPITLNGVTYKFVTERVFNESKFKRENPEMYEKYLVDKDKIGKEISDD